MKKRFLCAALAVALCLSFPALGVEETDFSDVSPGDWFAPYVEVCVAEGIMSGVGDGRFDPHRELSFIEFAVLEAKLEAWQRGETLPRFPDAPLSDLVVLYDGEENRLGTIQDCVYEPKVYFGYNTLYFSLPPALQAQAGEGTVTLELNMDVLRDWPKDPLEKFRPLPEETLRYTGGWDASRSCYTVSFGDDLGGHGPELLKQLDGLMETDELLDGLWFRDALLYSGCVEAMGGFSQRHTLSLLEGSAAQMAWSQQEPALRADLLGLMDAMGFDAHEILLWELPEEELAELGWEAVCLQGLSLFGILNGVDEQGTMAPEGHLTRAQVAAVLARTMRPELRIGAEGYSLTPVCLGDWYPQGVAADWLAVEREGPGGIIEGAIYRTDGALLDLEGGRVWVDEEEPSLGNAQQTAVWRGEQWGVYDVEAEKFVLPYTGWEEYAAWKQGSGACRPESGNRYTGAEGRYYSSEGEALTPRFEWAGPLNAEGGGFIIDWGRVYRIQLQEDV